MKKNVCVSLMLEETVTGFIFLGITKSEAVKRMKNADLKEPQTISIY